MATESKKHELTLLHVLCAVTGKGAYECEPLAEQLADRSEAILEAYKANDRQKIGELMTIEQPIEQPVEQAAIEPAREKVSEKKTSSKGAKTTQ